jgi:hypothetical protein
MMALIEAVRGETPVQEFLRALISNAVVRPEQWTDWEQRAREAERKLELVREALGEGGTPVTLRVRGQEKPGRLVRR